MQLVYYTGMAERLSDRLLFDYLKKPIAHLEKTTQLSEKDAQIVKEMYQAGALVVE